MSSPARIRRRYIQKCTTGTTRWVLLVGSFALKIARNSKGLRANRFEAWTWRHATIARQNMLCPVITVMPGATVIMMCRAEPVTHAEFQWLWDTDRFPDWDYTPADRLESPFEPKASDWGWIDGRLVAVDYSAVAEVWDGS